jgi:hypothetical protein
MAALVACSNDADPQATAPDSTTTTAGEGAPASTPGPSTVPTDSPTTAASEPFEFATYWERGFADPLPVDMYLYSDDPNQPAPYLLFGSVTNRGDEAVDGVTVHAAWFGADGAVVWEADTDAELSGRPELATGAAADWLFVVPPGDAPALDGLEVRLTGEAA